MKMDAKYVRRRRVVAIVVGLLLASLFTYATRDVCWTGAGYGSCTAMIDEVIANGR
jgi:hypothetical protein